MPLENKHCLRFFITLSIFLTSLPMSNLNPKIYKLPLTYVFFIVQIYTFFMLKLCNCKKSSFFARTSEKFSVLTGPQIMIFNRICLRHFNARLPSIMPYLLQKVAFAPQLRMCAQHLLGKDNVHAHYPPLKPYFAD